MGVKYVLLLLFLFSIPNSTSAQEYRKEKSNTYIARFTSWQSLQRPTIRNPLNTFYRFVYKNGEYKLELKISAGGMQFVVAQNAKLELITETGSEIILYNEHYQRSCKGCGSKSKDADIPGVMLSFPISPDGISLLSSDYLSHIRLYLASMTLGSHITLMRCETFKETLQELIHDMEHCK
jgi:hypothetical protein